ncbi:MAG: dTMP kinase [Candidatus Bathyarchaeota archaeon]|nr:dTMP kinase [Candidatus Bathyarchaeota archaeon]
MTRKGAFIVIEGLDGSGKTTQAKLLAAKLKKSHGAVYTAEPSRGKIGKFIRNHILYGEERPPTSVEALLFAADRIDHVQTEVAPALERGQLVVSDRYLYSSLAYQGSAGLGLQWIEALNQHALKPDLALFIDVDPETVLGRLRRKKSVMETLETQRSVRQVYLHYVAKGDLTRIDGNKPKKAVAEQVLSAVTAFLGTRS